MFKNKSLLVSFVKTPATPATPIVPDVETPRIDPEQLNRLAQDFVRNSAKVVVAAVAAVTVLNTLSEIAVNNTNFRR